MTPTMPSEPALTEALEILRLVVLAKTRPRFERRHARAVLAALDQSLMTDTPDTAESVQADAEGYAYDPPTMRLIRYEKKLKRAEQTIADARNYIGEPRSPFAKAIAEILDR